MQRRFTDLPSPKLNKIFILFNRLSLPLFASSLVGFRFHTIISRQPHQVQQRFHQRPEAAVCFTELLYPLLDAHLLLYVLRHPVREADTLLICFCHTIPS